MMNPILMGEDWLAYCWEDSELNAVVGFDTEFN